MIFLGKVLYYTLFYIVLGIIIGSYYISNKKRNGETEMLGKEAGRELKGIAILMVLLGHLSYLMGYVKLPLTPALGAPAVDIFLFLSAFGLMSSYAAKGLKGFAGRRLSIILIPYMITTLIKIPILPQEGMNWKMLLTNLFPVNTNITNMLDSSMWYVQYILLCYAVFFLVFAIPKLSTKGKTGIVCVIGIGLTIYFGSLYYREEIPYMNSLSESYSHHLSFPLGAVFYLVYDKAKKLSYKVHLPIAIVSFVIFQFVVFPGIGGYVTYYISNICYIIFFIAIFGVIKHFALRSVILQWMGDLSYYIYLNELIVIGIFYQLVPLPAGINGLLVMMVSIIAAIPVKYLCEWIIKKIKIH